MQEPGNDAVTWALARLAAKHDEITRQRRTTGAASGVIRLPAARPTTTGPCS